MVALFCVIGVFLGKWQNASRTAGHLDPISRFTQAVVGPLAGLFRSSENGFAEFMQGVVRASSLAAENRKLRSQVAAAALYLDTERLLSQRIEDLRKTLQLPPSGDRGRIPAIVIGYIPYENRMTLNAGKAQGVSVGHPAVTGDGLVGVVQTVESGTCQVSLVTSPTLRIGAMTQNEHPQAGLLKGESPDRLILEFLESGQAVKVGDWVVTSGFSERIPRGIPIGRVNGLENTQDYGAKKAYVFPSVRIARVQEVFILK